MVSPIERLPVEVFDIITLELDLEDYKQLRLTCRRLRHLGLSTYAKRHFSALTTTLGSPSLDRLVSISRHAYFRNNVTELNIKLLTSTDYYIMTVIRKVGIYPPPKRFPVVTCVQMAHIAGESTLYDDLLASNHAQCITDRLTRALKKFCNLKTIRFRVFESEPDWWQGRHMPTRDQKFRSKCFQAVLDSITESGIRLEEFCMAKKPKNNSIRKAANLPIAALQLPVPLLSSLQHTFINLQSLTLSLFTACYGQSRGPGWEIGPDQIIALAPNLKHLALSLDRTVHISHWSAIAFQLLAKSCRLSALETFHLVNCSIHEADLNCFVTTHAGSLRELILSGVQLLSGSWVSYWMSLKELRDLRCLRFGALQGTDMVLARYRMKKVRTKMTLDTIMSRRPMCDMLDDLVASSEGEVSSAYVGADVVE
jgi:hypothetical protein